MKSPISKHVLSLGGFVLCLVMVSQTANALEPFKTIEIGGSASGSLKAFQTPSIVPAQPAAGGFPVGTPVPTQTAVNTAVQLTPGGPLVTTICMPPGPKTPANPGGMDGLPCAAVGAGPGLFIAGICHAGQCRATSFTSAMGAFGNFLNGVAGNVLKGAATQLISGLLSGGGGGGYSTPSYGYGTTSTSTLEDIDFSDLEYVGTDLTGFDWDLATTEDNSTNLEYTPTTPTTPAVTIVSPYTQPPTITSQLYTTDARSEGGVAPIPGRSQFERDLVGITFNTGADADATGRTLSLADLERAAQEARLREAMRDGAQSNTDDLRDYRGSNIGNGGSSVDPNTIDETAKRPWWVVIVEFVGSLFGVAN